MSTMLNAFSERWILQKRIQYLMDTTYFEREQGQVEVMCPFCSAPWPQSRFLLARSGIKFEGPLKRTCQFCRCDLWTPSVDDSFRHLLELAGVRLYLNMLTRKVMVKQKNSILSGASQLLE